VSWFPPWSIADRTKWARARPWLSGFYFGLWMALIFGAYVAIRSGIELGFLVGGAIWAGTWPVFAIGTKRRWGLRPNIDHAAAPTIRRPFSEASDRWLSFFIWISAVGAGVLAVGLALGANRTVLGGFVPLALNILFLWTTWTERRHRANTH
jgi:hypothetical protein